MRLAALIFAGLLAFSADAGAAISFVNAADLGNNGCSTNSLTTAYTAAVGSSVLYVVAVGARINASSNITAVSYGGVSGVLQLTDSAGLSGNPGNRWKYIYAVFSPPSGSNNVVISSATSDCVIAGAAEYSGTTLRTTPDSTGLNDAGISTSVTGTTTVVAANSWVLGMGEQNDQTESWFAGAGATTRELDTTFTTWAIFDSNGIAGPGSYSMTVTISATPLSHLILDMLSFTPTGGYLTLMGCCN